MAPTNQELLDKARTALGRVLDSDAAEWGEGGHRIKNLELDRLQKLITDLEAKVAAQSGASLKLIQPNRML